MQFHDFAKGGLVQASPQNAIPIVRVPGLPRQLLAGAAPVSAALTATCQAITIRAVGADIRYMIGATAQTADASTSHFIADGERLDLAVPLGGHIGFIRDASASTNGVLELTELL